MYVCNLQMDYRIKTCVAKYAFQDVVTTVVVQHPHEANTGKHGSAPAYGFHICVNYVTM